MKLLEKMKEEYNLNHLKELKTDDVFERMYHECKHLKTIDFDKQITNDQILGEAFEYVVGSIEVISYLIENIRDMISYESLLESTDKNKKEEFTAAVTTINSYKKKAERVCGFIYEYLYKGRATNHRGIECNFNVAEAPILVNKFTHSAQTAIKDYNGTTSLENICLVYDLTVDAFNSSISVLNKTRGLNVPMAENSNLVALFLSQAKNP